MKRSTLLPAAIVLGIVLLAGGLQAQAYDLRCKGGEINMFGEGPQLVVHIILKKAVFHTNVGMGQCAWLDRPLNQYETPHVILKTGFKGFSAQYYKASSGMAQVGLIDPDPRLVAIINAMRQDTEYIIKVRNENNRYLVMQ
jgi:hypothetical protein